LSWFHLFPYQVNLVQIYSILTPSCRMCFKCVLQTLESKYFVHEGDIK
jgi:hypothetical protein